MDIVFIVGIISAKPNKSNEVPKMSNKIINNIFDLFCKFRKKLYFSLLSFILLILFMFKTYENLFICITLLQLKIATK